MPSNYALLVMYMRFGLAHSIIVAITGIANVAILLLPKTHPSRIYMTGRLRTTRHAMKTALSLSAARCGCQRR